MSIEWNDVADGVGEEASSDPKISIAVFYDNKQKRHDRVSSLPSFVRHAINKTVQGMSVDNPQTIQLFVKENSWQVKESKYPYYIASLIDEFAFTIKLGIDDGFSVERRYLCGDLLKVASPI